MYAEILSIEWKARLRVFRDYLKSVMFLPFPTLGYIGMAARGVLSSVPFSPINLDKCLPNQPRQMPFYSCDGRGVGAFASNCPIAGSGCRPIGGALHTWHSLSECETSTIISISTQEPNGISAPPW